MIENKKQKKFKLNIYSLCSLTFIISVIIMIIIYILNKVTPFGDKSLLAVDFFHQYGPMLGEMYDRVHNFSSLIYSFSMGMGLPIFRNFLNYLSSPLNIIIFFFKREHILMAFSFVIGLKAILSSVTMVYYLSKKHKIINLSVVPFGIIYGFSAYFSAYHWNLMWVDGMILLPLIIWGIEKIIDEGNWKFYTICLAIMLYTNYYIGYMICIFSVLYFIVYSIFSVSQKGFKLSVKKIFKDGLIFAGASLLAGGLICVLLLPLYHSLTSISATGSDIPTSQYYLFQVSDFLKYHFSGVSNTVFASDPINAPNISCGIFATALLLLFIINVELPIKKKLYYLVLLGFFVVAFFYAPLDFILQGFHVPNDLPYRYSFIYSFILVCISFYSFINLKKVNFRLSVLVYLFLAISLFIMSGNEWEGINNDMIYNNVILLSIYFVLFAIFRTKNINTNIFYVIIIILISCDVILSIDNNWDITHVVENFYYNYDKLTDNIKYLKQNDDELFYRIERNNYMTLNDPSWYNYYGITGFSSMNYETMAVLQNNLGMGGNYINSYIYKQQTPIYDLMFDVKYLLGYSYDQIRYTELNYNDDIMYRFNYNVGLAYGVNKNISSWNNGNYSNPFEMQNKFIEYATGVSDTLVPLTYNNKSIIYDNGDKIIVKYTYDSPNDNIYFYDDNYNFSFAIVNETLYYKGDEYQDLVNVLDIPYNSLIDYGETHIVNTYYYDDVDTFDIYVAYNNYYDDNFYVYMLDEGKFNAVFDKLQASKLNITSFKESKITGEINLSEDMTVYTSIPYDEGWHVLVDGKKVKTKVLKNALLTFDVDAGNHKIVIYYRIKGFGLGLFISVISLAIVIMDKFYHQKVISFLEKLKSKIKLPKIKKKKTNSKKKTVKQKKKLGSKK